ncbi:MAG: hypothetical protein IT475_06300 [Aquimonas sp.]|nr:hypothetical protein [Aquimonas sp.]
MNEQREDPRIAIHSPRLTHALAHAGDRSLDALRLLASIAVQRSVAGRSVKHLIVMGQDSGLFNDLIALLGCELEDLGGTVVALDLHGHTLPAALLHALQAALLGLPPLAATSEASLRARRALVGFRHVHRMHFGDLASQADVDTATEPGLADNGDLDLDLAAVLESAGLAMQAAGRSLVLLVDRLDRVEDRLLAALIGTLHACSRRALPVWLLAAGSQDIRQRIGEARPYAERLFDYVRQGPR